MRSNFRVFVTQSLLPEASRFLEANAEVVFNPHDRPLTEAEVIDLAQGCQALVSPFAEPNRIFSKKVIEALPDLVALGWVGAGFDHIDLDAATAKGIPVSYNDIQSPAVADHAFALILSSLRRIVPAANAVRNGEWEKKGYKMFGHFMGRNIHGKAIGIVGLGRIGLEIAQRASGFAMETAYCDLRQNSEAEALYRMRRREFNELLTLSDIVVCCLPLTDATERLFDEHAFTQMKPDALFVNVARGKCVDSMALYRALSTGSIEAAALDVIDPEPIPSDSPLLNLDNCLVVPHIAAITQETEAMRHRAVVEETVRMLKGYRPKKLLNPDVLGVRNLPIEL